MKNDKTKFISSAAAKSFEIENIKKTFSENYRKTLVVTVLLQL